jgi:hypothetical protein
MTIAGATKYDEGKPRWDLAPMREFEDIVQIMTFGANKYADNGWKHVDKRRYIAAMMRHITEYMNGYERDMESGLSHMAHAACNAIFIMYLDKEEEIDRPEIQEGPQRCGGPSIPK